MLFILLITINRFYANVGYKGTFSNQERLPRLPIPSLENLKTKYLESCRPLLEEEHLYRLKDRFARFTEPGGVGEQLQNKLIQYDKEQPVYEIY